MLFFPLTVCGEDHRTIDAVRPDLRELACSYAGAPDPFVYPENRLAEIAACAFGKDLFGANAGTYHSIAERLLENSTGLRACWHGELRVFNAGTAALLRKNLEAANVANEESYKRIMAAARAVKEAIEPDGTLVLGADVSLLPSKAVLSLFTAAKELFMSGNCVVGLQHVRCTGGPLPSSRPTYARCVVEVLEAYRRVLLAADRAYRRLHEATDCQECASVAEGAELWRMSAGNDAARQMGLLLQDVARATFDVSDAGYIAKRILPGDSGEHVEYHSWVLDGLSQEDFEDSWDEDEGFDYSGFDLNDQGFYGFSDDLHEWVGESSLAAQRVATWAIGAMVCDFDTCSLGGAWPGASFLGWENPENFEFARALAEGDRFAMPLLDGRVRVQVNDDGLIEVPRGFLDGCDTAYVRVEAGAAAARLVCRSRRRAAALFARAALADENGVRPRELFSRLSFGKILADANFLLCGPAEEPTFALSLGPGDEVLIEGHGNYFTVENAQRK